jgi:hypothetical protein
MILLLFFAGDHCILLHLPAQMDFILHHAASISIVQVMRVEFFLGGQKTSGQRNARARWWNFLLNWANAME